VAGHLEPLRCHYTFMCPHRRLKFGRELRTPAMQAGLVSRRPSFREIFMGVAGLVLCALIELNFRSCSHSLRSHGLAAYRQFTAEAPPPESPDALSAPERSASISRDLVQFTPGGRAAATALAGSGTTAVTAMLALPAPYKGLPKTTPSRLWKCIATNAPDTLFRLLTSLGLAYPSKHRPETKTALEKVVKDYPDSRRADDAALGMDKAPPADFLPVPSRQATVSQPPRVQKKHHWAKERQIAATS
jgi:hypothetical protein